MSVLTVDVVVTAAGKSARIGGDKKKEFYPLKSGTVLSAAVGTFFEAADESAAGDMPFTIGTVIITIPGALESAARAALSSLPGNMLSRVVFAVGGATRQRSVFNGLRMASLYPADMYLIHDGARPFVSTKLISRVLNGTKQHGACAPGLPVVETEVMVSDDGFLKTPIQRDCVRRLQTPQGFLGQGIFEIAEKSIFDGKEYTDDTSIWNAYNIPVFICPGDTENIKITYPEDLPHAENGAQV